MHFVPHLMVDHRLAVDVVVSSFGLTPRLDSPLATTAAIARLNNGWMIHRFALSGLESDSRGITSCETDTGAFFRAFPSLFGDQITRTIPRSDDSSHTATNIVVPERFSRIPPRGSRLFFKGYQGQPARRCGDRGNIRIGSW